MPLAWVTVLCCAQFFTAADSGAGEGSGHPRWCECACPALKDAGLCTPTRLGLHMTHAHQIGVAHNTSPPGQGCT